MQTIDSDASNKENNKLGAWIIHFLQWKIG